MHKKEVIYVYNLSELNSLTKVKFVQVLKGRNNRKGIVEESNGKFLVPGCFIIPFDKSKEIEHVFNHWNVKFDKYSVELLGETHKIDYVG
jgi:hypothetical protein